MGKDLDKQEEFEILIATLSGKDGLLRKSSV